MCPCAERLALKCTLHPRSARVLTMLDVRAHWGDISTEHPSKHKNTHISVCMCVPGGGDMHFPFVRTSAICRKSVHPPPSLFFVSCVCWCWRTLPLHIANYRCACNFGNYVDGARQHTTQKAIIPKRALCRRAIHSWLPIHTHDNVLECV